MRLPLLLLLLGSAPRLVLAGELHLGFGPATARALHVRTAVTSVIPPSPGTLLLGIPERVDQQGVGAKPRPADTLALSAAWYFDERWGLSLELGYPPTIEAEGYGVARAPGPAGASLQLDLSDPALNPLASQRQWSPALALRHRFGSAGARLRPYLALGLAYTWFTHVRLDPDFEQALDQEFGQPLATAAVRPGRTRSTLAVEDFWAPAVSGGARWRLGEHWGLGATAAWVPLRVNARLVLQAADGSVLADTQIRTRADGLVAALLLDYRL